MANEETRTLPGLDELGCGYDATGFYANPKSSRYRIFNLGKMDTKITAPNGIVYNRPSALDFELGNLSDGSFHSIKGVSAEEYRDQLTIRAGISASYGLFSADVTSTYKKEELASFNHDFVNVHHRFDAWVISLPNFKSLKMDPTADAAINGKGPAADVYRDYGTHVLVSAIIGGRGEFSCLVDKSKFTSSVDVTVAAKAAYAGVLNLNVNTSTEAKNSVEKFKSSTSSNFKTIGGTFDAKFSPESFIDWINSLSKNPVLVDFTPYSLIPIYELANTTERKAALMTGYEEYIKKSQKMIPDNVPAVEIRIVPASSVEEVANDSGSHAQKELHVYRPITEAGGEWRWVGLAGNHQNGLIIMRELVPGAIAEPRRFSKAWTDAGSGNKSGYSLWNIVAPPGYRALGGMVRFGGEAHDYAEPSGWVIQNLGCLHESLCTEGKIGNSIWDDHGTHATAAGSIWAIFSKNGDGLGAGTFYSENSHEEPDEKVYVVKRGPRVKINE